MPYQLPTAGQVIGERYVIEQEIGRGQMAVVYRVLDRLTGELQACKVQDPDAAAADPWVPRRFRREIRLLKRLDSPAFVTLYNWGTTPDGLPYYVMELLAGRTLTDLVEREPLDEARCTTLARQSLDALAELHGQGVIHRDLKPDNLMLVSRPGAPDRYKLVDYGLSRAYGETVPAGLGRVTPDGTQAGTMKYMAPEVWRNQPEANTPAPDLYALGLTLCFARTGQPLIHQNDPSSVMMEHTSHQEHRLPRELRGTRLGQLVAQLIRKQPAARPSAAAALAELIGAGSAPPQDVGAPATAPATTPSPEVATAAARPEDLAEAERPAEVRLTPDVGGIVDGRYRLETRLDGDGARQRYTARHLRLGRLFRLELLPGDAPEASRRQLEREAAFAGRLLHPAAALPCDQGLTRDGGRFVVFPCAADPAADQEPAPPRPALSREGARLLRSLLEETHRLGFLHGPLTPAQIELIPDAGPAPAVRLGGWLGQELPPAPAAAAQARRAELQALDQLLAELTPVVVQSPPTPAPPQAPEPSAASPATPPPTAADLLRLELLLELLRLRLPLLTAAEQALAATWTNQATQQGVLAALVTQPDPDRLRRMLFPRESPEAGRPA